MFAETDDLGGPTSDVMTVFAPERVVLIGATAALGSGIETEVSDALPSASLRRFSDESRIGVAAQTATEVLTAGLDPTPGDGVSVTMGRANWSTGYFQAELYRQLLSELGYEVSDPAKLEVGPNNGYRLIADGTMDFWVNSWYPGHIGWHHVQLDDGSRVGDHLTVLSEQMLSGGTQGFLVTKSFADEYDVYTLDDLDSNAAAIAAYDAADAVPSNGKADIHGCPTAWTCDDIINSQIALGGWSNIRQVTPEFGRYPAMVAAAKERVDGEQRIRQ